MIASKTSFWARPLKTYHSKLNACDVCSLDAHLAAFLKKRILTLITTRKPLKVLKVRQISVYALTVRLSIWVSDLVHEVSFRQQPSKRQGREKRNVSTLNLIVLICTYPRRIILKFIRSNLSGIQTYDICVFTGAPSVPKNTIFKTWDSTWCWPNSNLFDDSW